MRRSIGMLFALGLVVAACGGDEPQDVAQDIVDAAEDAAADGDMTSEELDELAEGAEEMVDDMVDDLQAQQDAAGGGEAELTIDGQTWRFDSVLCGIGPEEIGDPEAEFVLSALADGLQLYVSVDGYGHSVSLHDIDDFEDPSVAWSAGDVFSDDLGEFVEVDGKQVRAEVEFIDELDESYSTTATGVLQATCP